MTETRAIHVIDGEVDGCAWCGLALFRDGLPPVPMHGKRFHVVCARDYARDFGARVATDVMPMVTGAE